MKFSELKWLLVTAALLLVLLPATSGFAQKPYIDYYGYAWETGGFPPSDVGDELIFTCVADFVDDLFDVSLDDFELTFHLYGMTNYSSSIDDITNVETILYEGGYLDIYMDAAKDADWGMNPPNPTSPSTFTDGILFFHGSFTSFVMYMTSFGFGSYEGVLDGEDGWVINEVCADCAYTWGGAFTPDIAQVHEGYDLQIDGVLEMDDSIPTADKTWGDVKSLYR
jgi:hypothetical protein